MGIIPTFISPKKDNLKSSISGYVLQLINLMKLTSIAIIVIVRTESATTYNI